MTVSLPQTNYLRRVDWFMGLLALTLSCIGLALLFSAVSAMGPSGSLFLTRQIMWLCLALIFSAISLLFDYSFLDRWAFWIYALALLILIVTWGLGKVTAGSRRWIEIGFMRLQPSEFAKIALVIALAKHFSGMDRPGGYTLADLIQPLVLCSAPIFMVLIQPDLGTAVVMTIVSASVILFAGLSRTTLLRLTGAALCLAPVVYFLGDHMLLDYQRRRLTTFLNPDFDPLGAGYHIIQSQIAIGSGGAFGMGYMQGAQNQLMFLPVKHTDFIFSILAEEWGFMGCVALLALYAALFVKGLSIAVGARDNFGALLAFGSVMILFTHVFINIAMVMGLLPVVGVPLSFISYGGSSLIASFLCVAVLINISARRLPF